MFNVGDMIQYKYDDEISLECYTRSHPDEAIQVRVDKNVLFFIYDIQDDGTIEAWDFGGWEYMITTPDCFQQMAVAPAAVIRFVEGHLYRLNCHLEVKSAECGDYDNSTIVTLNPSIDTYLFVDSVYDDRVLASIFGDDRTIILPHSAISNFTLVE